jgi:hypothetical protein
VGGLPQALIHAVPLRVSKKMPVERESGTAYRSSTAAIVPMPVPFTLRGPSFSSVRDQMAISTEPTWPMCCVVGISAAGAEVRSEWPRKALYLLARDRWFESTSLQQRVQCEPEFGGSYQMPLQGALRAGRSTTTSASSTRCSTKPTRSRRMAPGAQRRSCHTSPTPRPTSPSCLALRAAACTHLASSVSMRMASLDLAIEYLETFLRLSPAYLSRNPYKNTFAALTCLR